VLPLELIFFRRVYSRLLDQQRSNEENGVALLCLQRSIGRLCRVLQDPRLFDAKQYNLHADGTVGWWEFSILWKEEKFAIHWSFAERVFLTLEEPSRSRLGKVMSVFVLLAILFSAGGFMVSTMRSMQNPLQFCCLFVVVIIVG
ncbi:unnamed protein product, partial [Polarella glacialis]